LPSYTEEVATASVTDGKDDVVSGATFKEVTLGLLSVLWFMGFLLRPFDTKRAAPKDGPSAVLVLCRR
jgi:hypothetical protein